MTEGAGTGITVLSRWSGAVMQKGEPMSVVIENMEMPEKCGNCFLRDGIFCMASNYEQISYNGLEKKESWCPLVEVSSVKSEQKWIPCSERLPEETVLVTAETKTFRHRYICEAVWIPRWTWKASFDNWEDCSEYNEDDDEFYVNEGWYERVHNWDEYSYVEIEDTVLAWMPLPELYQEEGE